MKFRVSNRTITSEPEKIISYAVDYTAEFEFDEEWAGKIITARFVRSNGGYIDVVLEDNQCNIPLFQAGTIYVGCFTDEFTSTYVKMDIDSSVKDLSQLQMIPPKSDAYSQLIGMIEAGRIKGDPGEPGPQGKPGKDGEPGKDYTITEADYQAIAERVPQSDLTDYVKNTDYATSNKGGVVKAWSGGGVDIGTDGSLRLQRATDVEVNNRNNPHRPITSANLDYAVKQAMCDGKGAEWTEAEKKAARQRIGEPQFELIEEITLTEDVTSIMRNAEPNGTPYNFRKVRVISIAPENGYGWNVSFTNKTDNLNYSADGSQDQKWLEAVADSTNGLLNIEFIYSNQVPDYAKYSYTTAKYINVHCVTNPIVCDGINKVFVQQENTHKVLRAGTNIKIYGIRG